MDLSMGEVLSYVKTLNDDRKEAIGDSKKRLASIVIAGLIALAIKSTESYYMSTRTEKS